MSVSEEVGTRLRRWRESLDLSREDVASRTGISMGTVRNQENGITSPNAEHLICYAELGLDPTWLVTGQERTKPEDQTPLHPQDRPVRTMFKPANESVPPDFTLIPRVNVQAAAGSGAVSDREDVAEMLAFRRDWLHRMGVSAVDARVITVRGDSMHPILQNGDIILIDASADGWLDDGGIYVIRVDNRLLVKRIATKVGGALLLISENPVYPPEEVSSAADLDIIGQVKWYGRALS